MACSCRTKKGVTAETSERVQAVTDVADTAPVYVDMIPHEVLPGESCIFCAGKHASMAYTLLQTGSTCAPAIGELELARRHTIMEFQPIASAIAEAEYLACMRQPADVFARIPSVLRMIDVEIARHDPDASEESEAFKVSTPSSLSTNPFLGEIHAYAAWRLATEVGYYENNRYMIIGDLALASQYMHDIDVDIDDKSRELRHRLEPIREADMDIAWPSYALWIEDNVNRKMAEYRDTYADGLRSYLGLSLP